MIYLTQNKYWNIVEDYNVDKLLYLLIDRPDYIGEWNDTIWTMSDYEYHRDYDLPACCDSDYSLFWFIKDICKRKINKPRKIWDDGHKEY